MASVGFSSTPSSEIGETFCGYIDVQIDDDYLDEISILEVPAPSSSHNYYVPKPPPLPSRDCKRTRHRNFRQFTSVPHETQDAWDRLFEEGRGADVCVLTDDNSCVLAHYSVLSVASPTLDTFLVQSKVENGVRYIKIPGTPSAAVRAFIRFLYSSRYDEDTLEKFALHLLVLSHCYTVPALKRLCTSFLEEDWLTKDNVVDMLQLAMNCDAPRLTFFCIRMILKDFKSISSTEGWKALRRSNPTLEQELLEIVVEKDTRKQERLRKMEERKVYLQLYEAMEALLHICKDGCRTIGPSDKMLKGSQATCGYPACKGLESLVRHFSGCKIRVPGGCNNCKRMWQLLELHSRMCGEPEICKVPLCRHFKLKMMEHSKKDEARWRILVNKVMDAKIWLGPFAAKYSGLL